MRPLRYLPLRAGSNVPAIAGWPDRASSDPEQIEAWRSEFYRCNFGILTGDGLGVLDVDTKNAPEGSFGGFGSLEVVVDLLGVDLSTLPQVNTAHGMHLYFRYDGRLPSRVPWLDHLDVMADGGRQVAGPGTVRRDQHGRERVYEVVRGSLEVIPFAPAELVDAIRTWRSPQREAGHRRGGGAVNLRPTSALRAEGFRLGERDSGFNAFVWQLTRQHYPHMDLVQRIAFEVWQQTDNPEHDPFPWAKVEDQIRRAEGRIGPEVDAQFAWATSLRGGA